MRMWRIGIVWCYWICSCCYSVDGFVVPSSLSSSLSKYYSSSRVASKSLLLASSSSSSSGVVVEDELLLSRVKECWEGDGLNWANVYLSEEEDRTKDVGRLLYSIFASLTPYMSVSGTPKYVSSDDLLSISSSSSSSKDYFTSADLQEAVEVDFLDAQRGSTDPRKGWQVYGVSNPRGTSMQDAKMTFGDIQTSLDKGTVIMNSIGAHIPSLAPLCLACCDATNLPNAVNMYLTAVGQKTSAPPHTDRQDVVIVQQTGAKRWRVFAPPNPSLQPHSDPLARGKMADALPLHKLLNDKPLLDVTLHPGDVLFIPAGFPHTTDTLTDTTNTDTTTGEPSLHLTFNFDSHVWDLNYLSLRQYALMRANVPDTALGTTTTTTTTNKYTGDVNLLPLELWQQLLQHVPLSFLDPETTNDSEIIDEITSHLEQLSKTIDVTTYQQVPKSVWKETVLRVRQEGLELLDVHRDMYLAAMNEGMLRRKQQPNPSSPMMIIPPNRLSIFRVEPFYQQVDTIKQQLLSWATEHSSSSSSSSSSKLADDWPTTYPLSVGDQVEADLGGAYFPASVTSIMANNNEYKITFFDGDVEVLPRNMIRLLTPPSPKNNNDDDPDQPPPGLTPKELKRWKKKMQKKKK